MPPTPPDQRDSARLALEDGTVFSGRAFGANTGTDGRPITIAGEVVFNTAMSGYQEALTDPSYAGQILVMTAPEIGNYGVNEEDLESTRVQVSGFVVRELSRIRSNYRSTIDLGEWLRRQGVLALEGVDTRALTRRLRTRGVMRGVLSADESLTSADLVEMACAAPDMSGQNLVKDVSPKSRREWNAGLGDWRPNQSDSAGAPSAEREPLFAAAAAATATDTARSDSPTSEPGDRGNERRLRIIALDCGAKHNILRNLADRGCEVIVLPHDATAEEIRAARPDGLFISNGPGDPAAVETTIAALREVAGEVPTFGICLGHQLLSLALGAKTYKLKFGHRGANQPVKNLLTGRVEITSQNHGFAVDPDSIRSLGCEPTHINLNDGTLAGFRSETKPIFAVQYHPEASPGPHDASYLFDCFIAMIERGKPLTAADFRRIQCGAGGSAAPHAHSPA